MNVAVIDCETTGLGRRDRIVEVAVVVLDSATLNVIDEFETLVNPERDIGPTHLHGITATMVSVAPTFAEVVPLLAQRLNGAVLAAHNLSFDVRMLSQEVQRTTAEFAPGEGLCTLRLTGQRLAAAARENGIPIEAEHRALADARVAAQLLIRLWSDSTQRLIPAELAVFEAPTIMRTHRRDTHGHTLARPLTRALGKVSLPTSDQRALEYLDALDWALADSSLADDEALVLADLAVELGIDASTVEWLHHAYYRALLSAARRDGIISESEVRVLEQVAAALRVPQSHVPPASELPRSMPSPAGSTVCFTGTAVMNGLEIPRRELESLAAQVGLQPVASVTKKLGLCVAADTASSSGKAQKARSLGVSLISVEEFFEHFVKDS